jgi:hypothetical protein
VHELPEPDAISAGSTSPHRPLLHPGGREAARARSAAERGFDVRFLLYLLGLAAICWVLAHGPPLARAIVGLR